MKSIEEAVPEFLAQSDPRLPRGRRTEFFVFPPINLLRAFDISFFSYGGSAISFLLTSMGFVLNVSRNLNDNGIGKKEI